MEKFMEHVADFSLSYGTIEEFNFRKNIFDELSAELDAINADPANTFTVAHNFLSTMTKTEKKRMMGYLAAPVMSVPEGTEDLPEANGSGVNWVTKGAVNPPKNQGACGSCWSFSAVATIEGAHQIATGNLESYAEQFFVSCDSTNFGCNGGVQTYAFAWAESNNMYMEDEYPYTSGNFGITGSCKESQHTHTSNVHVTSYKSVLPNFPNRTTDAIDEGPVSVAIQADQSVFQNYSGGILNSTACGTDLDHAVTGVGWGVEGGVQYVLVKNSWGTGWGDGGYVKIANGSGAGICGINRSVVQAFTN